MSENTVVTKSNNRIVKTKVVCTIGPTSWSLSTIKELIQNGMRLVRLNKLHSDEEVCILMNYFYDIFQLIINRHYPK